MSEGAGEMRKKLISLALRYVFHHADRMHNAQTARFTWCCVRIGYIVSLLR